MTTKNISNTSLLQQNTLQTKQQGSLFSNFLKNTTTLARGLLIVFAIAAPLTACQTLQGAGTDKFSAQSLQTNIKIGVSTPEDIRNIFGAPDNFVDGVDGPSYWVYDLNNTGVRKTTGNLMKTMGTALELVGLSDSNTAYKVRTKGNESLQTVNKAMYNVQDAGVLYVYFKNNRVTNYSIK